MQSQFSSLERRFLDNWRSSNDELAADQKKLQEGKKEWQAALTTTQVSERGSLLRGGVATRREESCFEEQKSPSSCTPSYLPSFLCFAFTTFRPTCIIVRTTLARLASWECHQGSKRDVGEVGLWQVSSRVWLVLMVHSLRRGIVPWTALWSRRRPRYGLTQLRGLWLELYGTHAWFSR